jgi:hypothetical protein
VLTTFPGGRPFCYLSGLQWITATALAQFQSPKLSAVAMGQVTKMTVIVKGGPPPRKIEAPAITHTTLLGTGPDDSTTLA